MLSILLLGPPQMIRDGAPVDLPRRRARALVFYLAAQQGPVSRDQLLGVLWPDHERGAAQQILRTTLHGARRALGPALTGDDPLAIAPDTDIDYRVLAAAVADPAADEGALAAALGRYRDDLLAGFELGDAESFGEWLAAERERARLVAVRGLTRLARMAEARRDLAAALEALRRALAFDPLQEDLQRDAIRLHYQAGDRVGAIRRYEQLRDLLDEEMGVPPMAETRALYDAIITDTLPAEPPPAGGPPAASLRPPPPAPAPPLAPAPAQPLALAAALPFTGRAAELARLEGAVAQGRLALVEGEPGIGKTRLANAFLDRTRRGGGIALVGTAHELEQALPYQPVIGALRSLAAYPDWPMLRAGLAIEPLWLREAARLVPELAEGDLALASPGGRAEEARLWEGVARLLLALAARGPVGLLLDDLHWADASTLGLLGYLLRRAEGHALGLVATARPAEPRSPLSTLVATLTREGRVERLALRRLNPHETQALAHCLSPGDAEAVAAWLQQNAEGNPYIIAELVSHARETGLLGADGRLRPEALGAPVVPQNVYSLIESRLARLSEGARRVLDAAVATGREFEFEVAARAAALSEAAALDALDELRAARLVEPLPDGRYSFDHSLTMEVAYREVGEPRHRAMHRRVAEAIEALHRDRPDEVAGIIASHYAEGGAPERAAAFALRAGRHAAAVAAWAEAVAFYEQALVGTPPAQRFAILMAQGDALYNRGENPRAAETFRTALGLARDPADAARARLSLAGTLIPQARFAEVIDLVRDIAATGAPADRAQAMFRWGTALSLEGADLAGAALRLREAERLVAEQPALDPVALAQVRFELGSVAAQQGDLPRAVAYYHEALSVADTAPESTAIDGALAWRILARNNLAYHLHLLGDLEGAARYAAEALSLADERGALGLEPYLRSTAGEIAMARGDLDAAESSFAKGLALAERLAVPERVAGLMANLGLVAQRRGELPLAIHRLSAALARADALGTRHLAAQVRIWLAPLLPPAEARAALVEARAIAESGGRRRLLEEIDRIAAQA